ncbi:MAG: glycosyltransferase family 39 protein [Gemmataceae bacterium]|nr:glycosyltransferase family 39 protein [Gemmataceae bacterium]
MADTPCAEKVRLLRWAAFALIAGTACFRLVYLATACPLDLAPDEAHYWDWSRNLDWSYYSKGPLVAYLIRLSCWLLGDLSRALTGHEALAVRVPAVLSGALFLTSLYVLTAQVFRRERLALAVVALALTLPILSAGALLMTIDSPFICLWSWALVFGYRAVFRESSWSWAAAGVCVGLGILAKYTMVLWAPCLGLFLLCTPTRRRLLLRPGFWLLVALGALAAAPILWWNSAHDWATLRHTQGHAGIQDGGVRWLGPFNFVGQQFALLLGYWFVVWAAALWLYHPGRERRPELRYLWFFSVPVFLVFGLFSWKNGGGEPNWPVAAYVSGLVLASGLLARQWSSPSGRERRWTRVSVACCAALGLALTVAGHDSRLVRPLLAALAGPASDANPTPLRRFDPTCRLRGWRTLAGAVDEVRETLRGEGKAPLLAGAIWNLPGELGFYCQGQPKAYSFGPALGDRRSQYDIWRPNPVADARQFLGADFIIVGGDPALLRAAFESVENAALVVHREEGMPVARWHVYVGKGFQGFAPTGDQRDY